jgi:hypothetical protein
MKLSQIKPNPANPRVIKDDAFRKLCNSIKEFPAMMALRPIVVDRDGVILGGNMRYKAMQHLGMKEVPDDWVKRADELTDDEKRRFIIADNVSGGEWDMDALANEWDVDELNDWGLNLDWPVDYSDKNKELSIDDLENETYFFKLNYSESEYMQLKEQIERIGKTPEQIFYEALISVQVES